MGWFILGFLLGDITGVFILAICSAGKNDKYPSVTDVVTDDGAGAVATETPDK